MSAATRKIFNHATGEMWVVEVGSELETNCLANGWSLDEKPSKKSDDPPAGGKAPKK